MFTIYNVYINKMLSSFYMGCIWELLENWDLMIDLEKNYNTDCMFICGIADEGIIKSDKL